VTVFIHYIHNYETFIHNIHANAMYMYTTQKIVVVNQNIVTATAKHAIRKMEKKAKC